jgi:hypothetical protein
MSADIDSTMHPASAKKKTHAWQQYLQDKPGER